MAKNEDAEEQPQYATDPFNPYAADSGPEGRNVSMLTGKLWEDMTPVERSAHQALRGTGVATPEAQAYLDATVGDAAAQQNLAITMRDAAGERIADGTFNTNNDPNRVRTHQLLADLARPASGPTTGGLVLGPGDDGSGTSGTLGVSTRDAIDTSDLATIGGIDDPFANEGQQSGAWDNGEGWTIWNPETNSYENYASDPNDPFAYNPRGDLTSWYINENGVRVLGFKPAVYATDADGNMVELPSGMIGSGGGGGNLGNGTKIDDSGTNNSNDGKPSDANNAGDVQDNTKDNSNVGPIDDWDKGQSVTGTPPPGYGGGYDWNWDDFQPGAPSLEGGGGYDPNDYAFDRYVPGQESPWGIPEIEGGNKDFYRNQFVNLLKDEQNFQARQDQAALARQDAMENPIQGKKADWSWINNPDGTTGLQSDPFRTPYGVSAEYLNSPGFGYSTEQAKYIINPTKGENSQYILNPAYSKTGDARSSGDR